MQAILIFLAFLTAHVLADFVLQRDEVIAGKRSGDMLAFIEHGLVHLLLLLLSLLIFAPSYFLGITAWWLLLLLAISHAAIDWIKENTGPDGSAWTGAWAFVLDQFAHVVVLLSAALILTDTPGQLLWSLWAQHSALIAALTVAYLLVIPGAGHFNRLLLQPLAEQLEPVSAAHDEHDRVTIAQPSSTRSDAVSHSVKASVGDRTASDRTASDRSVNDLPVIDLPVIDLPRAGRYIGWLERFLILTAVLLQAPTAVGLVLAAKSVFRFGEISRNRQAAEYFLIGTLISVSEAVLVGLLVHWLLRSAHIW